jgi:acid phosphatase
MSETADPKRSRLRSWAVRLGLGVLAALAAACAVDASDPAASSATTAASAAPTTSAPGPQTVFVVGDWGSDTAEMRLVASEMADYARTRQVEAILTTGDNFYQDEYQLLLEPYRWATSSGIEFWVTWGNHDIETPTRIEAVDQAFDTPPRMTSIPWGGAEILILDSNAVDSAEQLSFIESEMERIESPTIVVFHHPAFSCGSHGSSDAIVGGWVPRFDDDVVLVLTGHDHNYQRFEFEGVDHIVSGGGGRNVTPLETCPEGHPSRVAGAEAFHFLAMTQGSSGLDIEAVGSDGAVIDSFSIGFDPAG